MSLKKCILSKDIQSMKNQLCIDFKNNNLNGREKVQELIANHSILIKDLKISPKKVFEALTKWFTIRKQENYKFYLLTRILPAVDIKTVTDVQTNDINCFLIDCDLGTFTIVKMVCEANCDCIYYWNSNKSNGLHLACQGGNYPIVKYIVNERRVKKLKMLVRAQNKQGRTPLHCAVLSGNVNIVKILLNYIYSLKSASKYLSIKDKRGRTPLKLAIKLKNTEIEHVLQPFPTLPFVIIINNIPIFDDSDESDADEATIQIDNDGIIEVDNEATGESTFFSF